MQTRALCLNLCPSATVSPQDSFGPVQRRPRLLAKRAVRFCGNPCFSRASGFGTDRSLKDEKIARAASDGPAFSFFA
ncbi:MAG: hypothetical protein C6W56_02375 [Caldibacillus debilis]|nr:MAG: hypothetical protein C6W56_02375 [Caldibacillus debilis]